ncbi:probable 3-hydroxyisobutyrate dehydrogenase-like 2, mitochondrial [Dendrobium catenatum]|uniref:Putative 3-hydroxyisobutyrate dehydrogenase-like 1, mitochondrial n=1 Tax=Dendrobium catenatum TaxID=906689 RepID=A0A2I0W4Z1_9ASPA|nr:probable 3-hydroxyisobutyrate dehydrogenase-like 2, mitochondrial [Dendrobium catenatum]PKU70717.1 putative 3-hydroxyisobutyrate dehydrogenase-like 1, mitochondrial [Dendrobium catenatum]
METLDAGGGYPRPIRPDKTRVGWIGTGVMGATMAGRILAAGYSLAVYARTPSKAAALAAAGARLASTPADAAKGTDVVFTMVGHPSDVRATVLDPVSGVLAALSAGGVIIDHTSSHPALAREIAAAALARDCWSIDAPVSGGDVGARDGKLAIFAGGEEVIIRWLTPLWEILGKATPMGGPGSGQSSKIANQITVGGSLLGLSEALVFARSAGLDAGEFLAAVRGGAAGSAAMEIWGDRVIERDFRPGGFVEYMVKDLGMGLEDGDGSDEGSSPAVLPGSALCRQLYQAMVANGDGKMGTQGLITVIERINGK